MQSRTNEIKHFSNNIIKKMKIGAKTTDQEIVDRMNDVKSQPIRSPMEKRIASRICCILGGIVKRRKEKWYNDRRVKLLRKLGYFTN